MLELPGFGAKTQEKLIEAIRYSRIAEKRKLLDKAWIAATEYASSLVGVDGVVGAEVGGEVRRFCETVGSLDVVVIADDPVAAGDAVAAHVEGAERAGRGRLGAGVRAAGRTLRVRIRRTAGATH